MKTRRFNWIILLVGGAVSVVIGVIGVAAGHASGTVGWFTFGVGLLVGSMILKRMRLTP